MGGTLAGSMAQVTGFFLPAFSPRRDRPLQATAPLPASAEASETSPQPPAPSEAGESDQLELLCP
jgi:hypothetical protein